MLVGMTFDLQQEYLDAGYGKDEVAELDSPVTVEAIRQALLSQGHEVELVGGVMPLARALADGRRWDMVFNFAEGMRGLAREAQVPALLDAWDIPYTFSGPEVLALCLHKGWTNAVLRAHDVPTADFRIVNAAEEADGVELPFPLFVKPVAEGSSKGVSEKSLVRDRQELREICAHVLNTFRQPALVETFLPGREFTVGLLGSGRNCRVLGVMEVLSTARGDACAYTYANKQEWRERALYELADDDRAAQAAEVARAAWEALGCLDAGRIDVRLDAQGQARFIEVNPLAGLNPESSDLPILCGKIGLGYDELIAAIMNSAMQRAAERVAGRHS
ncbi:MAG: D-alanine--D-alanine ligase [Desulfomicrobium sp.]|nr:D-alanine--D-alanine ligase [Pseudomonadota bacterium]MBV1713555.1 D-alanine--D-alanine ligase [Desulfomicrobium sp.]MBU4572091.1 D-alanine--D-alanine ligase [Pseudomonadota bacterium]MBU4594069.1 D-alanine--D-alanine ligase [Pseudomonadota bacterium]MBV1720980.1 D-alanine--D-alanine ligase [Desulfomicrobium sp.]